MRFVKYLWKFSSLFIFDEEIGDQTGLLNSKSGHTYVMKNFTVVLLSRDTKVLRNTADRALVALLTIVEIWGAKERAGSTDMPKGQQQLY